MMRLAGLLAALGQRARAGRGLAGLLVASIAAGCTVGPAYQRPPVTVPGQFYGQSLKTGAAQPASLADLPWWEVFKDPVLRPLIEEALRNGYDARIAAARVEEARARFGIAGSQLYPQLGYQGQYTQERLSRFSPNGTGATIHVITANVSLSWELDIWGRIRRLNEAAKAQYLASEEARQGVLLTLVSEIATAYFDLRQLDEDLEIARATTASFQDTFNLFERRLEGGTASGLETANAEASLDNEAAQIPLLENQIVAKENQLDLLLGRGPGPIPRGTVLSSQPVPEVPAGLPSALLERRPDLRQAEQQLIAANANVGAAQAAYFPDFSLTGLLGGLSPELSQLFGEGKTWSIAGGLMGPIFNGGNLRHQVGVAAAQREQAQLQYEQAVTNALGEVSSSLVALQKLAEAETHRVRGVAANQDAVRLARLRYDSGLSAYFEVINAQEQLLSAQNSLAQTRHDRLVALVQFYKALGGGWQVAPAAPGPAVAPTH